MALTLIIGGARSGKSDLALRLAAASGRDVLFVATMQAGDDETRARIDAHRAERPAAWRTIEAPIAVADAIRAQAQPGEFVLLDCVTLWVSNLLLARITDIDAITPTEAEAATADVRAAVDALAVWGRGFGGEIVIVTNEVGLGVVPAYPLGRLYRDALGAANAAIARDADRVYATVAGLVLDVTALGARPVDAFRPGSAL